MDSPYLTLREAAVFGCYKSENALRHDMSRGLYKNGIHYFNKGGRKSATILFWRDKFRAALEGSDCPNPLEISKEANRNKS